MVAGHAAHKERQRQYREHRQHTVKRLERCGNHLAQHHIVSAQVGQEQQAKRAVGFLSRERVGGRPQAGQQAVNKTGPGEDGEKNIALHQAALQIRDSQPETPEAHRHDGDDPARQPRAEFTGGNPKFTLDDGQADHGTDSRSGAGGPCSDLAKIGFQIVHGTHPPKKIVAEANKKPESQSEFFIEPDRLSGSDGHTNYKD